MRRLRLLSINIFLLLSVVLVAQTTNVATYYKNANGKKGEALKTAMYNIIKNPDVTGYDGLFEAYKKTDTRTDGKVRDWYSKTTNYRHVTDKAGSYSDEGDCYNREHTVPQSWFGDGKIKSDIVHVVPTDGYINGIRSNYPFGEVANADYTSNGGYCKKGKARSGLGYQGTVFEPGYDVKGDLARIYFYMATCYQDKAPNWGNGVFTGDTYQPLASWAYAMFLRWAQEDPIDDIERKRNNAVEEVQGNRNPFVDYEGLEQYIWGDYKNVAFSTTAYVNPYGGDTPSLQTPTASFALASKTLEVGNTYQQQLTTNSNGTVSYTSSNPNVASVDAQSGMVTALAAGSTTITATVAATATYLSAEASYTIVVKQDGVGPTPQPIVEGDYVKVTSAPDDWSGTYLIVCEDNGLVMNGALDKLDVVKNTISVSVNEGVIADSDEANAAAFTISKVDGGYTIQSQKGLYIGQNSNSNGLQASSETSFVNAISINADCTVNIVGSGGAYLRFNAATDQMRFRYFKSSTYSAQKAIALYVKTKNDDVPVLNGDVNADGSISVADVTALVNIILGRVERGQYAPRVADVNGDGNVSVADVTALVNLILGKMNE